MEGAVVVERCPVLARLMPRPNEMGRLKRINCRSISIGVRKFKDYVLGVEGVPAYNRCLRISTEEKKKLFVADQGIDVAL